MCLFNLFKWALESITMNKVSGGDGIPVELLQILKDDAVKVLHSICQHIWKTQQWPQDWKRSVFIPILKKGNAEECSNYHTIALIHTLKGFSVVNEAEIDGFLEFSCFFYDPMDVGKLILLLFETQLLYLKVLGSHTVEASLGEF